MLAASERCGRNRVYRRMHEAGIASQRGYRRKAHYRSGEVSVAAPNHLNRAFNVENPNTVWVTDITYNLRGLVVPCYGY